MKYKYEDNEYGQTIELYVEIKFVVTPRWTQEPARTCKNMQYSQFGTPYHTVGESVHEYNNDIQLFPIMRTCRIRRLFGCPRSTARG